jgi:hypothetical protein
VLTEKYKRADIKKMIDAKLKKSGAINRRIKPRLCLGEIK